MQFKLIVFVPFDDKEALKEALSKAGAGRQGNYEACFFETRGIGQFRPLEGANPSIGKVGALEKVDEVRLETIVDQNILKNVMEALKRSHPYEEPAFDVIKLYELS